MTPNAQRQVSGGKRLQGDPKARYYIFPHLDSLPSVSPNLNTLQELNLNSNSLTSVSALSGLASLVVLRLNGNRLGEGVGSGGDGGGPLAQSAPPGGILTGNVGSVGVSSAMAAAGALQGMSNAGASFAMYQIGAAWPVPPAESYTPRRASQQSLSVIMAASPGSTLGGTGTAWVAPPLSPPLFPLLTALHLAGNGIAGLPPLQLGVLSTLRSLTLLGNEITRVEGLEGLCLLTELVLDQNKIR